MRKLREGVWGPGLTRTVLSSPRKDPDHCHSAAHDSDQAVTLLAALPLAGEALWSLSGSLGRKHFGAEADTRG